MEAIAVETKHSKAHLLESLRRLGETVEVSQGRAAS